MDEYFYSRLIKRGDTFTGSEILRFVDITKESTTDEVKFESDDLESDDLSSWLAKGDGYVLQSCYSSSVNFTTTITHSKERRATFVFLYGLTKPEQVQFCTYLRQAANLFPFPELVPAILMDLRAERSRFYIDECHQRIMSIEQMTKIHGDASNRRAAAGEQPDLKSLDFDRITQELTSLSAELAYSNMSVKDHLSTIDFVSGALVSPFLGSSLVIDPNRVGVHSKLRTLVSFFESVQDHTTYLSQRSQAQVQNVYNLIAQRDSASNLELAHNSLKIAEVSREDNIAMQALARDSKEIAIATSRDSATMRIISGVTTLFLPATFTATLFSTSFFNFQGGRDSKVVSWWIWLYWLVTVLLTLAIHLWWYLTSKRKEEDILRSFAERSDIERPHTSAPQRARAGHSLNEARKQTE
ncbi:hypothetical protein NA57DRAFT_81894 [Rhizodiscina lignyota]|uniref:Uncharacterized protein n=1 Tax=Rhizodiscina lignyota TaxID=1504668 RepID=A0A9P4I0Y8_9PEZI|nr:hypothetical protein NA57DRAFT_81894 [Rhizodiscina lignyota]